ncbi:MAG: sigma-70 family RNA polymerase sigma factor [Clostridiales bacterium]|nr:sigma-70 family RNA polymerase sigma factor [Clostridiales bacterium]
MNNLDFSFEPDPWDTFRMSLNQGDTVSAAQILTILEGEDGQTLENALQDLETACVRLDISDLPKDGGSGDTAVRLKQEVQLVREGLDPKALEPNDPLRLYLEEVTAIPACGDEQILAQSGGSAEAMTNLGLRRVIELAQEYVGYGVLLMDLIQEGSLGLWQAIGCYRDGDYAAHRDRWIHFYLARAVILQAHASGIGQKMRRAMEDYRQVDERLLSELGRNPTIEEIAEELHMSVEEIQSVRKMMDNARMLDKAVRPEEEEEDPEAEQAVQDTALFQMRQRIGDLLSNLDESDAKLLTLRFGLEGGKPASPEEAGRLLGMTAQDVLAREAKALAKLRNG